MKFKQSKAHLILLIIGIAGILDTIFVLLISSINLGTILPGIVGAILVAWSIGSEYVDEFFKRPNLAPLKKFMVVIFALWLTTFIFVESLIISSHSSAENVQPDYLIILGAGLRGERLSKTLYARMQVGLDYLQNNSDIKVIVSGGRGPGEDITEAEAMKRFLVSSGIAEDRIIKEESSTSTFENFKHSKQQVLKDDGTKVLIVTNDFHMFRAKLLAERAGLVGYGLPSKTPPSVLLNCYLREYFAVIKSFVFDM